MMKPFFIRRRSKLPKLSNAKLAWMLSRMADLMEIKGEESEKISSFRKASSVIEGMEQAIAELKELDDLELAAEPTSVLQELLSTGESEEWKELHVAVPTDLQQLLRFPDITVYHIGRIYRELGIDTFAKLEVAAKKQKLRTLSGFGAKIELNLSKNLKRIKEVPEQFPIAFVYPISMSMLAVLREYPEVSRVELAGGLRRFTEMIEMLVIVIATEEPQLVITRLLDLPDLHHVHSQTKEKLSVTFQYLWPLRVDFLLVSPDAFAHSWLQLTGSIEHYEQLLQRAKKRKVEIIHVKSEQEIYEYLSLPFIPPEVREGKGEIERIEREGKTPRLIQMADLLGDLHMHTNWSDGGNRIEEMARAAYERGYRYIAITDHSRSLKIAGGLSIERLLKQKEEIKNIEKQLQKEFGDFTILCGVEMDILADGILDYPDEVLQGMDLVIGSIHTAFNQDEYRITKRIMDAILNNHVDFIAHPTGRMIGRRAPYAVNMEVLFTAAKETGTALELNCNPNRLDLKPEYLQEAIERHGIPITINTDAHSVEELNNIELGIGTARRGWVRPEHVINTWPLDQLREYLRRND